MVIIFKTKLDVAYVSTSLMLNSYKYLTFSANYLSVVCSTGLCTQSKYKFYLLNILKIIIISFNQDEALIFYV